MEKHRKDVDQPATELNRENSENINLEAEQLLAQYAATDKQPQEEDAPGTTEKDKKEEPEIDAGYSASSALWCLPLTLIGPATTAAAAGTAAVGLAAGTEVIAEEEQPKEQRVTATEDAVDTRQNNVAVIDVLANDRFSNNKPAGQNDEGALEIVEFSQGSHGLVELGADNTLIYTPEEGFTGNDSFTYTVQGDNNSRDTTTVTVAVLANQDPVANSDTITTDEDTAVVIAPLANDTDPEDDPLTITKVDTENTTGTANLNEDGTVDYDPNGQFNALTEGETVTDIFHYTLSDGQGGFATESVTVTITGVNDIPTAEGDAFGTDEDTPFTFTNNDLLANDQQGDLPASTSNVDGTTSNGGAVVDNGDGSFTYTPTANFNGDDSFSYTLTDNDGETSTATVTISVGSVNDIPQAVSDSFTSDEDTPLTITHNGLLANDAQGDLPAVISGFDGTTSNGGTVVDNGDGSFTYTPAANFNGDDSFNYTLTDNDGEISTTTVNISVSSVSDAPAAVSDEIMVAADSPTSTLVEAIYSDVNFLENDLDPDGDSLTIIDVNDSNTQYGTLSLKEDGSISFIPNDLFHDLSLGFRESVSDFFTYTISDGNGGEDTAQVHIDIINNELPSESFETSLASSVNIGENILQILEDNNLSGEVSGLSLNTAVSGAGYFEADEEFEHLFAVNSNNYYSTDGNQIDFQLDGLSPAEFEEALQTLEYYTPLGDTGVPQFGIVFFGENIDDIYWNFSIEHISRGGLGIAIDVPDKQAGAAIASIGDFDQDGLPDLVAATPTTAGSSTTGSAARILTAADYAFDNAYEKHYFPTTPSEIGLVDFGENPDLGEQDPIVGSGDIDGDDLVDFFHYMIRGVDYTIEVYDEASTSGTSRLFGSRPINGADMSGDYNGDGYTDLLIGVSSGDGEVDQAFIQYGSPVSFSLNYDDLSENGGTSISNYVNTGGESFIGDAIFADAVSNAGDVNGDGIDDLVIGAVAGDEAINDSAYVIFGAEGGLPATVFAGNLGDSGFRIVGDFFSGTGISVSGAGDFNNDGFDDLIVGAPYTDEDGTVDAGSAYIVYGYDNSEATYDVVLDDSLQSDGLGRKLVKTFAPNDGSQIGSLVSHAGDVNADGYSDVLISSNASTHGRIYVVHGRDHGNENIDMEFGIPANFVHPNTGPTTPLDAAIPISYSGDVNGDGLDDIVFGEPEDDDIEMRFGEVIDPSGYIMGTQATDVITPDNFNDSPDAQSFLLGAGNDTLTAISDGADKIFAGAGDDTIIFDAEDSLIDGGFGIDTLLLDDSLSDLDLIQLADQVIKNIEIIDAENDSGQFISLDDLAATGLSDSTNQLIIFGDSLDTVDLDFSLAFEGTTTGADIAGKTYGGTTTFNVYGRTGLEEFGYYDVDTKVYIVSDIAVQSELVIA